MFALVLRQDALSLNMLTIIVSGAEDAVLTMEISTHIRALPLDKRMVRDDLVGHDRRARYPRLRLVRELLPKGGRVLLQFRVESNVDLVYLRHWLSVQ